MSQADTYILREESDLNRLYDDVLVKMASSLEPFEVEVKEYKPKRSILQNRLYWEYMTQLGEHTGHTKEEMHLFFRWKFLGASQTEIYGQSFNALPSTQDLNVKEFAEYLRSIEVFASEQGFTFKAPSYYDDAWR